MRHAHAGVHPGVAEVHPARPPGAVRPFTRSAPRSHGLPTGGAAPDDGGGPMVEIAHASCPGRGGGSRRGGRINPARAAAERAHGLAIEPNGQPMIAHVRRVAAMVPPEAVRVAWLHDVLEWTGLTEHDLAPVQLSMAERQALRLLTRTRDGDEEFLSHLGKIVAAEGSAGRIARAVKWADMVDRSRAPRDPGATWVPPYARALRILDRGDLVPATTSRSAGAATPGRPTDDRWLRHRRSPVADVSASRAIDDARTIAVRRSDEEET